MVGHLAGWMDAGVVKEITLGVGRVGSRKTNRVRRGGEVQSLILGAASVLASSLSPLRCTLIKLLLLPTPWHYYNHSVVGVIDCLMD